MTAQQRRIWLLRERDGQPDPFEACFEGAGFEASSHPVLTFEDTNDAQLDERLVQPDRYSGLILTSPRASIRFLSRLPLDARTAWLEKPVYVVGERTGRDLRDVGFSTYGEDSGDGGVLGRYIADHHSDERPLLFLAGNRRRTELVDGLAAESIPVSELTVYITHAGRLDEPAEPPEWLAFFSPSGVDAIAGWRRAGQSGIAAIGMTTARALESAGLSVRAVSSDPTPESLRNAVLQAG